MESCLWIIQFQSTPSARRATPAAADAVLGVIAISIHALREESDSRKWWGHGSTTISIHALREESDFCLSVIVCGGLGYFNPRPPRGERRSTMSSTMSTSSNFNPRPPRGERPSLPHLSRRAPTDFNPRPPRGERPPPFWSWGVGLCISIHALREESDSHRKPY